MSVEATVLRSHCGVPRRLRVFQLLLALMVLLVSTDLWAMGPVAGMCDPSASSAPAPIPALPQRGGSIDALDDCDQLLAAIDGAGTSRDRATVQHDDSPPRSGIVAPFSVLRLPGVTLPALKAVAAPSLPGHAASIYRPPR